jgi:hypothetical protein
MPYSIKLEFKLVPDNTAKTYYQTALLLENLKLALSGCHQKTVGGAIRGSPIINKFFEVRFAPEYMGKYSCRIYYTRQRHDGSTYRSPIHQSGSIDFTKETKDDREFFVAWLSQEVERLRTYAEKPYRNREGGLYWHNIDDHIAEALVTKDEEITGQEFDSRKAQLYAYLCSLAESVRKLKPEPGKWQAIPDPGNPEEWHNV